MISVEGRATVQPLTSGSTASPDRMTRIDVPFDGIAGVGVRVEPWRAANGRRFVGLTFVSALAEQSHDLTPDQALALRDALTEMAGYSA